MTQKNYPIDRREGMLAKIEHRELTGSQTYDHSLSQQIENPFEHFSDPEKARGVWQDYSHELKSRGLLEQAEEGLLYIKNSGDLDFYLFRLLTSDSSEIRVLRRPIKPQVLDETLELPNPTDQYRDYDLATKMLGVPSTVKSAPLFS